MSDCRRNINIAHRYPQEIVEDVKPQEVISLFRNTIGKRAGVIREVSYSRLKNLMDHCMYTGRGGSWVCVRRKASFCGASSSLRWQSGSPFSLLPAAGRAASAHGLPCV